MYVLEVIPLSRTAPSEPLSYRSRNALPPGSLVEIPLRKQRVAGLVVSSEPVRDAKATLKLASFSLSKSALSKRGSLPPAVLAAARAVATYHATTLGAVLAALFVPILSGESPAFSRLSKGTGYVAESIEAPLLERQDKYESFLKENSGTLLVVAPTIIEAQTFAKRFEEYSPIMLSSALSPGKRESLLAAATTPKDVPRLVIATPGFAFVSIPRLERIIVERVSAGSYTFPKRPYIDLRIALAELARARALPITCGDYPLPLEYRRKPDKGPAGKLGTSIRIIDARAAAEEQEKWRAIPGNVQEEIAAALARGGTVGVLAVRRGYAPTIACRDCGTTVTDEYNRTLSLVTPNNTRVLRSADGRTIENIEGAKVLCKNCGSWNLLPLGVGVERVAEELRNAFPDTELIRLDADTISARVLKQLAAPAAGGRLVVGTEVMLPYLSPAPQSGAGYPLNLGVIASADSLLSLPFWRARERFVRIGLMLAERSKELLILTRQPENSALAAISNPQDASFWKEETGLRRLLNYPPFGRLIVIRAEGNAARIAGAQKRIAAACAPHTVVVLPQRAIGRNLLRTTSVLHLPEDNWPNPALAKKLAQFPPFVRVHIDAETFW